MPTPVGGSFAIDANLCLRQGCVVAAISRPVVLLLDATVANSHRAATISGPHDSEPNRASGYELGNRIHLRNKLVLTMVLRLQARTSPRSLAAVCSSRTNRPR